MPNNSSYIVAQQISSKIESIFALHINEALLQGESNLAIKPSKFVVETIIDVAFWTSLRKEEGHSPKISLAYVSPNQLSNTLYFKKPLPLTPAALTKLASGVERSGVHIGICENDDGELCAWGTTMSLPNFCLVVDVPEPGLLVVKHRRISGLGKFTNVAILKGDQVKIINNDYSANPDNPALILALLDKLPEAKWSDEANIMIQLAISMRRHNRGGALLIVDQEVDKWRESVVNPINYEIDPPYGRLANLIFQDKKNASEIFWQTALKREVDYIAGLTAVDGATIISKQFDLLAFGAKLTRAKNKSHVGKIYFSEPVEHNELREVYSGVVGGTRHLSAAQFINDNNDAIALVASQDGHFTIYSWSEKLNRVHAHRVDTLLV